MIQPVFSPVLAFDTCCPEGSVALLAHGQITQHHLPRSSHATLLVQKIQELLHEANLSMRDISTIVTTLGPGSFTGIRVSLAAAQGFMLAHPVTVKTCTSLQAIAYRYFLDHPHETTCEIWLNAGKGEAYTQAFKRGAPLPETTSNITLQALADVPLQNSAGNVEGAAYPFAAPRAEDLCAMAAHLPTSPAHALIPIYIRAPDACAPAPFAWLATQP